MFEQELRQRLTFPPHQVFTEKRIRRLTVEHKKPHPIRIPGAHCIEVGRPFGKRGGEVVRAIFETTRGWYMVCTWSRGIKNRLPLWIPPKDVVKVDFFPG